ncbi:Secreted effector protein pipB2 [Pseudoruegeria aquimaris]|uniref:Secreted effector protein pipB2 n=1 Tax=Pseudoruegeria aquimaris TaxID=393663 RepID=A0A1Y5S1F0_9RHOB|nr:pentapeptide repeat-containing protein [Pseudoruegeria aquimaris]SLN27467.1 Secreted effector protein pipB2 [Pseudoruegeria aquimaris]
MLAGLALGLLVLILALAACWLLARPAWMGFEGKTLWDWLAALMNATVLGIGTLMVGLLLKQAEENRIQEAGLQAYFDRMAALHVQQALPAPQRDAVARAQTSAILAVVDGPRAGRALRFLDELGTLERHVATLEGARLSGAELKGMRFRRLDFEEADLSGADMEYGRFDFADFEDADLRGADLKRSTLAGARFDGAHLSRADLEDADLRGAELSAARGLKRGQLAAACFDATTTLPESLAGLAPDPARCAAIDGPSGN